jgi:hypothetical protein
MANGYRVQEFPQFGGLDFRTDPQEGPLPALDLQNVDLSRRGVIRMRAGLGSLAAGAVNSGVTPFRSPIFTFNDLNVSRLIFGYVTGGTPATQAFDYAAGTTLSTAAGLGAVSAVQMGGPSSTLASMYIADGNSGVYKYTSGAGFSAPASMPGATYVTSQQPDNRLVAAATVANPSRVFFSGPNTPETFDTANDYVDLDPGDGERIVGAVNWGGQVFIFKLTKFFVFTGNSTDSTGGAVFNYRTVRHNLPPYVRSSSFSLVAAGVEGIYFLTRDGVYLTTGGQPVKISAPLDPLFAGDTVASAYFTAGTTPLATGSLHVYYAQRKVFVVNDATNDVYVYFPETQQWSLWDFGVNPLAIASMASDADNHQQLLVKYVSLNITRAAKSSDALATDLGGTMSNFYQTGFLDLGGAGDQKRVREWLLYGSGSLFVRTAINDQSTFEAGAVAPAGPIGAGPVYEYRHRVASRARNISLRFAASSAWSMSRVVAHVAEERPAGVRAT